MSIKGITDKPSFPRMGKIHLGIVTGKGYPQPIDYFLVKEDGSTSKESNESFHSVYGNEPRSLDIILPFATLDDIFPQWWKRYVKRGQGSLLACRGDGQDSSSLDESTGAWTELKNGCIDCQYIKEGLCKKVGNLKFMLPFVKGGGIWQLDTGSYNSIRNLNGTIYMAIAYSQFAQKPLTEIPCKLIVQLQDIPYKYQDKTSGETKTGTRKLPILSMIISESLIDIIKNKGGNKPMLSAPSEEEKKELPEDLVPSSVLEQNEKIDEVAKDVGDFLESVEVINEGTTKSCEEMCQDLIKEIKMCKNAQELRLMARKIAESKIPKEMVSQLSVEYNAKQKELTKV